MVAFSFSTPLVEGLIVFRKNRFIMEVLVNDKIEICHCPCTGRIGNIVFKNIPCLLTLTNNKKTKYTVEAISLNNLNEKKYWIGINQIKANKYVEFFLQTNQLSKFLEIKKNNLIQREKIVGKSKLDFLVDNNIKLEVKTPLIILPLKNNYITNKNLEYKKDTPVFKERFFKHLDELSNVSLHKQRSILICFYMFESLPFVPPVNKEMSIQNKVYDTLNNGVEMWQVNCKFNEKEIKLVDYYKMF
jgi:sugar fermentation stimulation protein A